jgi:hypothetical protein
VAALLGALRVPGLVGRLRRLLAAAVWGALGSLLLGLWLLLHTFQAFTGETLIAEVSARRLAGDAFELTYRPVPEQASGVPSASRGTPLVVQLRGDQWAISGGVVKWHPWLTWLGVKSYHKPLRLSGQFSDVARQRAEAPTVYQFDPAGDRLWEMLYWADPHLPFIEAVYGSAAYVYVEPRLVQHVYATLSGYLIKRKPG